VRSIGGIGRFESDEQLTHWLVEDQVSYDPNNLSVALRQLESIGG
jgi:hypothetical protein